MQEFILGSIILFSSWKQKTKHTLFILFLKF
jgi:hypothetical protein